MVTGRKAKRLSRLAWQTQWKAALPVNPNYTKGKSERFALILGSAFNTASTHETRKHPDFVQQSFLG